MDPLRLALVTVTLAAAVGLGLWSVRPAALPLGTIATVNGTALTEADLLLRLRPDHQRGQTPADPGVERRKNVLETMISDELKAQRAHELGLDADAEYLAGLAPLQAQVDAYKRRALGELLARHEVDARGAVTDAEARKFFDDNAGPLTTQLQVWQILRRSEAEIQQAQRELAAAPSFEAYAQAQFPQLTNGERPWDLGFLRWEQLPEQWREVVYGLKKGDVSPIIRGPKDRFWILRIADIRQNPAITFESIKPTLVEALKGKKALALQEQTAADLRAKAKVVYLPPPPELH